MKTIIKILLVVCLSYTATAQSIDSVKVLGASGNPANHIHVFQTLGSSGDTLRNITLDSINGLMDVKFYFSVCGGFAINKSYDTLIPIPNNIFSNLSLAVRTYGDTNTVDSNCLILTSPSVVDSFFIFPTKVSQYQGSKNIVVHPNPTSGRIRVKLDDGVNLVGNLTLYNLQGILIKSYDSVDDLKFEEFAQGFYIIEIPTNKGILRKRILKE